MSIVFEADSATNDFLWEARLIPLNGTVEYVDPQGKEATFNGNFSFWYAGGLTLRGEEEKTEVIPSQVRRASGSGKFRDKTVSVIWIPAEKCFKVED